MQRIVGPESLFTWVGLYPEQMGHFIERANAFALEILKAQIKAAGGLLDGIDSHRHQPVSVRDKEPLSTLRLASAVPVGRSHG